MEILKKCQLQDAELPQFTIKGFETNERKIKLATGTYQVSKNLSLSKNYRVSKNLSGEQKKLSTEEKNYQTNIFVSHHQLIKQRDIKVEDGGII